MEWLARPNFRPPILTRFLPENGVLVVEPQGPLRSGDFDELAETVDPWIEIHGALQGLVIRTRRFPSWEDPRALARHIRFVRNHHRKVRRVAVATDAGLARVASRVAAPLVEAEVRQFEYDRADEAVAWAAGGDGGRGVKG